MALIPMKFIRKTLNRMAFIRTTFSTMSFFQNELLNKLSSNWNKKKHQTVQSESPLFNFLLQLVSPLTDQNEALSDLQGHGRSRLQGRAEPTYSGIHLSTIFFTLISKPKPNISCLLRVWLSLLLNLLRPILRHIFASFNDF